MKYHTLPDCLLVWLMPYLDDIELEHEDELCEQGYADYKWGGINEMTVRWIRGKR